MFGTDFDMVLADTHPLWVNDLIYKYGCKFSLNEYEIKIEGVHWKKIANFINEQLLAFSDITKPIQNSVDILPQIMNFFQQDYLPIITSRYSVLYDCTESWCKKNLPVPFKLFFTNGTDDKSKIIIDNGITVFADDRLKTVNQVAPFISVAYLIDQEWNRNRQTNSNVVRVKNLMKAFEHLKRQDMAYDDLQKISL